MEGFRKFALQSADFLLTAEPEPGRIQVQNKSTNLFLFVSAELEVQTDWYRRQQGIKPQQSPTHSSFLTDHAPPVRSDPVRLGSDQRWLCAQLRRLQLEVGSQPTASCYITVEWSGEPTAEWIPTHPVAHSHAAQRAGGSVLGGF